MRVNRLSKLNIPTSEENYTLGPVNNSLKTGKKRVKRGKYRLMRQNWFTPSKTNGGRISNTPLPSSASLAEPAQLLLSLVNP